MPIFEYKCDECGHVTEFLEAAGKRGPHPCEKCASTRTQKQFSTFAAQAAPEAAAPACGQTCKSGSCPYARG